MCRKDFKNMLAYITGENKIVDTEEELRQIGENLKALEVAEEKAQQREEEFKRQMKVLIDRLKEAESRLIFPFVKNMQKCLCMPRIKKSI